MHPNRAEVAHAMASEPTCKVKDDLVNQLIALNSKLNTLSPSELSR
jgi:hypothetical protein